MAYITVNSSGQTIVDAVNEKLDVAGMNATLGASGGSAAIGFLQAGAGAIARTAQAKLRESVSVKDFGAVGDGSDETSKFLAAAAASKVVVIPSPMTLCITNAVVTTDLHIVIETGATIKQFAGSDVYMLHSQQSLKIDGGGTIDGNFSNMSVRSTAIRSDGEKLSVRGVNFKNTYSCAIFSNIVSDHVDICDNRFSDMAEHGGVLGQVAQAIYIGNARSVTIRNNRFIAVAPSVLGRSPGGIQVAVTDPSLYSTDCIIEGNHFERIGMSSAANYLGCVDLYTNAKNTVVANNICINSAYIPLKLQNAPNVSVTGNIIQGYTGDTSVSNPMITFQNARSFPYSVYGVTLQGNIVDLGSDTTQICMSFNGDATYTLKSAMADGNVLIGGARGIVYSFADDVVISNNLFRGMPQAIRFVDLNDAGGVVSICGNTFKTVTYGILTSSSKMLNMSVNIVGNSFSDIVTASILIASDATRFLKAINVIGNTFTDVTTASGNVTLTYATSVNVQSNIGTSALPFDYSNITTLNESGNTWNVGLIVRDGVSAPATKAGVCTIYVDSADGDLKIKFGDGVIKTITTDV
jgi:hypothetical protein